MLNSDTFSSLFCLGSSLPYEQFIYVYIFFLHLMQVDSPVTFPVQTRCQDFTLLNVLQDYIFLQCCVSCSFSVLRICTDGIFFVVVFPFTFKKQNKALKAFRGSDTGSDANCTTVLCEFCNILCPQSIFTIMKLLIRAFLMGGFVVIVNNVFEL